MMTEMKSHPCGVRVSATAAASSDEHLLRIPEKWQDATRWSRKVAVALLFWIVATSAYAEAPHAQLRPLAPGWIAIDWEHPDDGATSITLERQDPAFTWIFVALVNSFTDMGLQPSHVYQYRVCANYAQTSDCSSWLTAQTLATPPPFTPPSVPIFTSASASVNGITVTWSSSESYGFYQVRWARNGDHDEQNRADGRSFTVNGLRPGTYHFIVQGCHWGLLGSSCSRFSEPMEVATWVPPPPPPAPVVVKKGVIYAVTNNDDLLWNRHEGRNDGSFLWASNQSQKVGVGWSFKKVFPGGEGVIYGVQDNGDLMWYHHAGRENGEFKWDGPKKVGSGWGAFKEIFSGGNGIIYVIEPIIQPGVKMIGTTPRASGGNLMWYRHRGWRDGSSDWEGPRKVGTGWGAFKKVFSGGDGVIYVIQDNGDLMWYRHTGSEDGSFRWEGPKKVGSGWGGFEKVFSGGDGVIYCALDNGDLLWFRHDGRNDGSFRWATDQGRKVGAGWWKLSLRLAFGD